MRGVTESGGEFEPGSFINAIDVFLRNPEDGLDRELETSARTRIALMDRTLADARQAREDGWQQVVRRLGEPSRALPPEGAIRPSIATNNRGIGMTGSNSRPQEIEALCREAVKCRACFDHGALTSATIDIAQPRWIGDGYWTSSPRVCVVMLVPGAGANHNAAANRRMQTLLQRFRSGETGLDDVFGFQRRDFPARGNPPGRFLNFFRTFGLDIDRIALANVAWCATNDNHYPRWMLNTCMRRFTGRLIDRLKPDW